MSQTHFLEIVLVSADFKHCGRDEIEEPLDAELQKENLGEVTGGGSGMGSSNIDVEVKDVELGLIVIRRVLQSLAVAQSTTINQYQPERIVHHVYG